jgi:hypothetical protein
MRGQVIWNILLGLVSGPILAGLILLIPLGMLTGVSAALDPSLAMYEYTPEKELLIPWLLLAALISAANIRLALLLSKDRESHRMFEVTTPRYADDPSGAQNVNGHRGKQFAEDLIRHLAAREGDKVEIGEPVPEDYGWGFWIGEKGFSPLWVAIAQTGAAKEGEKAEDYLLAVTLEPPLLPWRRLTFQPDFALRDRIENHLADFLTSNRFSFNAEADDWVDPEPRTQHEARF